MSFQSPPHLGFIAPSTIIAALSFDGFLGLGATLGAALTFLVALFVEREALRKKDAAAFQRVGGFVGVGTGAGAAFALVIYWPLHALGVH